MCLKSCVVRQQQICRFQAGQAGAAEFKKQNNQLHAGMCWYVLVCGSTKYRKFGHVKVCTRIYWYILYTFNFILFRTVLYHFIPFHTHTSSYHLIPSMRIYEIYILGMTWYVLFHTKTLIFIHRVGIYRYIPVYTGTYRYIRLQARWSGFQMDAAA